VEAHAPHLPVLAEAVLALLVPRGGDLVVVDATVGGGGHAERILEALGPGGFLLGIDRDEEALAVARRRLERLGRRARLVRASFAELARVLADAGLEAVDGVLYDLGVSSMHLDDPARGFSYRADGPLDMRMDRSQELTARDVVNTYSEEELARVLRRYGEERWASRIASFIVRARRRRPLSTTLELVDVIRDAVPTAARRGGPHPARRTFQALRIEVNRELDQLEASLPQAVAALREGGRLVAISYHSLEDRIVKRFLVSESRGEAPRLRVITSSPLRPGAAEVARNRRARAAKLRAAERLAAPPRPWTPPEGSAA
jgi:16S rRNA (cytosine1402-N4)-methyltransferase